MSRRKCIALIAHDEKKDDMAAFAAQHEKVLSQAKIVATGTTGGRVLEACPGLDVTRLKSGPLGGDQQIGALVATEQIDLIIFLRDPLTAQPHEPDITALIRICDVHNIPAATNIKSANILIDYITHNKE